MTTQPLTARIEVFRPGTFKPMEGEPITYSAADLRAIADAYDPEVAPAPIVVGHPDTDAPAFGWVDHFDYDAPSERLFANLHEIEPQFADLVKAGRFKKVSMAFFAPKQSHNPVPGTWYPKHVGFLGAAAPAVSGLKNAKFAAGEAVTFTAAFGNPAAAQTASILRSLRDFFIDLYGIEDADKALPSWNIEWLGDLGRDPPPDPAYSEGAKPPVNPPQPEKEPVVTTQPDPAFAEREADLARREAAIAEREAATVHAGNVAFAEGLVQDGRLLPILKDQVVALLDGVPAADTISFAAGEPLQPAEAIRKILEAAPKIVSFGDTDLPAGPGTDSPAKFAADGKDVDPEGLAVHNKALEYQRQHTGTAYLDAVRAVS
ncbi:hypothetical protein D2T29_15890 [Sinirhodobacter populi]|uniref:Peptidase n=1 Tax=Paenirhodobacter populi TaxID=2306993 RepID=A0A443K7E3_9RHOB|nr:hypothetical protein [Sinirhodobacter populi]RWR28711.1 hypothetical protein D2T29_15890 [Sinirhodobacter populi]